MRPGPRPGMCPALWWLCCLAAPSLRHSPLIAPSPPPALAGKKAEKREAKKRRKDDDVARAFKEAQAGPDLQEQARLQVGRWGGVCWGGLGVRGECGSGGQGGQGGAPPPQAGGALGPTACPVPRHASIRLCSGRAGIGPAGAGEGALARGSVPLGV